VSAPLVGRSSKKKRHSKIGSFLWSWSNLSKRNNSSGHYRNPISRKLARWPYVSHCDQDYVAWTHVSGIVRWSCMLLPFKQQPSWFTYLKSNGVTTLALNNWIFLPSTNNIHVSAL
jgi:hypothetical protein